MKKILAMLLCVIMVVSMAAMVHAEGATYTKVTSGELTSGQYVLVDANGNAPAYLDGGWILAAQPTIDGGSLVDAKGAVWTITVVDGGITLKDINGKYVAPKGGNANGIIEGEYVWSYSYADGLFTISGQGEDTVALASNVGSDFKYRGYKNGTIESQGQEKYPSLFTLYKVEGDAPVAPPATEPTEPAPTEPVAPVVVPEGVNAPVADTAYNFGLYQAKNDKVLYVTGEVDERYLSTTENVEEAAAVYAEAVDGGYKFYILVDGVRNYITVYNNDQGKLSVKYDAAGTSVYAYNAECNNWVTVMDGNDYYLGTYNTYNTISASKTSYIKPDNTGVSQFPANLYAVAAEEPAPTEPAPTEPAPTEPVAPIEPPVDTGDAIGVVVALLAVSGTALVVLKKKEN